MELDKVLDRTHAAMPLDAILDAPVSALHGVSEGDAEHLKAAFGITTIGDLAKNKYFQRAYALYILSGGT